MVKGSFPSSVSLSALTSSTFVSFCLSLLIICSSVWLLSSLHCPLLHTPTGTLSQCSWPLMSVFVLWLSSPCSVVLSQPLQFVVCTVPLCTNIFCKMVTHLIWAHCTQKPLWSLVTFSPAVPIQLQTFKSFQSSKMAKITVLLQRAKNFTLLQPHCHFSHPSELM